jgi:hypothetical protein
MKIIKVYPHKRTNGTPIDENVRIDCEPGLFDECDEVHISVAFTWCMKRAGELEKAWRHVAPVKVGGPAFGKPGGEFIPGKYLRIGYTITSRGCPNHCWFCKVPSREGGKITELPIREGWNVLDDNLLACSEDHIRKVFAMLKNESRRAEFTGGLEAKLLKPWHVDLLHDLKPKQIFMAYDTEDDFEPLVQAARLLHEAGFTSASHALRCYLLCGFENDTMEKAEKRILKTEALGIWPMPMVYRDEKKEERDPPWVSFQSRWTNWHKRKAINPDGAQNQNQIGSAVTSDNTPKG